MIGSAIEHFLGNKEWKAIVSPSCYSIMIDNITMIQGRVWIHL